MSQAEAPKANTSKNTLETIAKWLGSAGARRILDVPCGEGALLALLKTTGADRTGADIRPECFKLRDVTCIGMDMSGQWPIESATYDAVVCADGIEHVENPFHLVREANRVLARSGILIISTPNINAIRSRWRFLWSGFHTKFTLPLDESARQPHHHLNPIGFPELRYILHTGGFAIERVGVNRIKAVSWPYAVFYPGAALYTLLAFRRETSPAQRRRNPSILRTMISPAVFLGETLIVQARKQA